MKLERAHPAPDAGIVANIARRALDCMSAEVMEWTVNPLHYDRTTPSSGGVYRVAGRAVRDGQLAPWSVVLKVLQSPAGMTLPTGASVPRDLPDDPTLFGYWKREALAYEAGVFDTLPGYVAAPRCYGVSAPDGGVRWLWLEEVAEAEERWKHEQYRRAGRALGRFNGAYLAGLPLPARPWLSGRWLRSWLALPGAGMVAAMEQPGAWEHPAVQQALSPSVAARVRRLWAERDTLLAALEGLPQALCHRDAFRANLFTRPGKDSAEGLVAIDWAFVGRGPVGEEIAPLIAMQPAGSQERFTPWELEEPVFDAYLQGLEDAGWRGDPLLVRFGYAASAALRYTFPTVIEIITDLRDNRRHRVVEGRRGIPFQEAVERQVALAEFLLDLADEARTLMGALERITPGPRPAVS